MVSNGDLLNNSLQLAFLYDYVITFVKPGDYAIFYNHQAMPKRFIGSLFII